MESIEIQLLTDNGFIPATVILKREDEDCHLTLSYLNKSLSSISTDFYDALIEIRKTLEQDNIFPHCYGASRNVFPSGMSRDMGNGLKAYKTEIGKQALRKDLVEIFDVGDDIIHSTIEEQKTFHIEWVNYFKNGLTKRSSGTNNP